MKTTITFTMSDLPPLTLEVQYNAIPAVHDEQGIEPAQVEVQSVRCIGMGELPVFNDQYERLIGALAYAADPKQVERLCIEAHADEHQGDPDRERE